MTAPTHVLGVNNIIMVYSTYVQFFMAGFGELLRTVATHLNIIIGVLGYPPLLIRCKSITVILKEILPAHCILEVFKT